MFFSIFQSLRNEPEMRPQIEGSMLRLMESIIEIYANIFANEVNCYYWWMVGIGDADAVLKPDLLSRRPRKLNTKKSGP